MGLAYVGLRVTDLDRSIRFYTEGLGLVVGVRGQMSHGGTFVGLKDPTTGAQLELNYYPEGHPFATPYTPGEGLDHLGFEVPDARSTIERLRAQGAVVRVEPWLERERFWIGFVRTRTASGSRCRARCPEGRSALPRLQHLLDVRVLLREDLASAVVAADAEQVRVGGERLSAPDAAEHGIVRPVRRV